MQLQTPGPLVAMASSRCHLPTTGRGLSTRTTAWILAVSIHPSTSDPEPETIPQPARRPCGADDGVTRFLLACGCSVEPRGRERAAWCHVALCSQAPGGRKTPAPAPCTLRARARKGEISQPRPFPPFTPEETPPLRYTGKAGGRDL